MQVTANKTFRRINGIKIPYAHHKTFRKLRKDFRPSNHGHKVWPASWLLIDYLRRTHAVSGRRVLDLGCGWGVAGIYCALQNASVTCVDMDPEVHPYMNFMAALNKVELDFLNLEVKQINKRLLGRIDVLIAADICYCDSLIDPLKKLIRRAKAASVSQILISDPGRWPFDELAEYFVAKKIATIIDWETRKPQRIAGKILHINFQPQPS